MIACTGLSTWWATSALSRDWFTRIVSSRSSIPLIVSAMPATSASTPATSIRSSKCPARIRRAVSVMPPSGVSRRESSSQAIASVGSSTATRVVASNITVCRAA